MKIQKGKAVAPSKKIGNEASNGRESFPNEWLLPSWRVPELRGKEDIWGAIQGAIVPESITSEVSPWHKFLKIAAILLPLAVLSASTAYYFVGNRAFFTQPGAQLTVYLPDSSRVVLNADTRISYNSATWFLLRRVTVAGEALFYVRKGKQFSVITSTSTTQVLGTVFNVYSRMNEVRVTCIEGRVQVTHHKTRQSIILYPGLRTVGGLQKLFQPVVEHKEAMASWINGEFYFANEPLGQVLRELSRQYNITVSMGQIGNRSYTGYFNNKNLSEALNLVCQPMNLSWKELNGVIHISERYH